MISTIGCLSYTPLGFGTPQIQYLLRDLAAHYRVRAPVGVFAPRWESHQDQDERFPEFHIHHFWPVQGHKAALRTPIPELISYLRQNRFTRLGIYGAGTHTKALREIWAAAGGPAILTLITSEEPPQRMVDGLPAIPIAELEPSSLDFVVLSSQSFEREMSANLRRWCPGLPFAALYEPRLSLYPSGKHPEVEPHVPAEYEELRTQSAARWLDAFRPDLLLCTHFAYFEALAQARHRPRHIIYHAFELPAGTDGHPFRAHNWDEHALLGPHISLALHPEAERQRYYNEVFQWKTVPSLVVYNGRPLSLSAPRRSDQRNGRVIIQGGLSAERNFIAYLQRRPSPLPRIDVYGQLQERDNGRAILLDAKAAQTNGYRYCGFLTNDEMAVRRRDYAFAFVSWSPTTFDALHACPNKFFEAIADGVPPLAAPHPQCREIIQKFDCGILLRDWSLPAFLEGLREAKRIYGTPRYHQLVANCRKAHESALCWEKQFARIRRLLPSEPAERRLIRRRRFVLLDPTLRGEVGHHYHYAEHVLAGASRQGFETIAGVNRMCEVHLAHTDRVHPLYWFDFWGRNLGCPGLPRGNRSSEHFVAQTKRILALEQLDPNDEVFVPNISDDDLAALADYLLSPEQANGPRWHLFVRHDLPPDGRSRIASMQALGGPGIRDRIFFYTDTPELAQQHQSASGVSLTVLPIPVAAAPMRAARRVARHPIIVTYLGDARTEKGYHWLPELVRQCSDLIEAGKLAFVIQTVGSNAEPLCDRATAELEILPLGDNSRLYKEKLPTSVYDSLLRNTDVVLALYKPEIYQRRSSHVVVEGLCSGKIVLATRGSAPAALLPADCPWLCSDVTEGASVLRRLVDAEPPASTWEPARKLRANLASFHNGCHLAKILIEQTANPPVKPALRRPTKRTNRQRAAID